MKENLLKKFKPQSLDDFNISELLKEIIMSYISSSKMLFIIHGNAISGKTSLINTILKLYYGDNIGNNVLSFNLLKEQGINYYRNDLKNFCQINNLNFNSLKKKTIVFDDIDLLNEQSQQIFSNLLSTYKNINFIFSCNDINKIQKTLLQRLEYIKIDVIDNNFISKILNNIILNENISLSENNINKLIKISNCCIPNLINIIDKMMLLNDTKNIENLSSNILKSEFDNYIELCKDKNYKDSFKLIEDFYINGYSVIDIVEEFFNYIKIYSNLHDELKYKIIKLLSYYITIFNNLHEDVIELFFMTKNLIEILNNKIINV